MIDQVVRVLPDGEEMVLEGAMPRLSFVMDDPRDRSIEIRRQAFDDSTTDGRDR